MGMSRCTTCGDRWCTCGECDDCNEKDSEIANMKEREAKMVEALKKAQATIEDSLLFRIKETLKDLGDGDE